MTEAIPNPAPVSLRSVDICCVDLQNGRVRLVEAHESGGRWLEISDEEVFQLEDLE